MQFRVWKKNVIFASVTLVAGFVADQLTKRMAEQKLVMGKPVVIIENILNMNLVKNTGAAFGMGRDLSPFWQNFIFLGLSSVAIILIAYFLYKSIKGPSTLVIAISMILAGALGNVIDRLRYRHVVDFIEVHYKNLHWPNFNIADTLICVGVGLYFLHSFSRKEGKQTATGE